MTQKELVLVMESNQNIDNNKRTHMHVFLTSGNPTLLILPKMPIANPHVLNGHPKSRGRVKGFSPSDLKSIKTPDKKRGRIHELR